MSMAEERPGVIERAFQLARSGTVASLTNLRRQLSAEGYANSAQLLAGRSLTQQLSRMIAEARLNKPQPPDPEPEPE